MITSQDGYKYYGLKTDEKPTDVNNGDEFYVIDDGGKKYMFDAENKQWHETSEGDGGGGGSSLPPVTAEDNGDVLTVVNGAWAKAAPSGGLRLVFPNEPTYTRIAAGGGKTGDTTFDCFEESNGVTFADAVALLESGSIVCFAPEEEGMTFVFYAGLYGELGGPQGYPGPEEFTHAISMHSFSLDETADIYSEGTTGVLTLIRSQESGR